MEDKRNEIFQVFKKDLPSEKQCRRIAESIGRSEFQKNNHRSSKPSRICLLQKCPASDARIERSFSKLRKLLAKGRSFAELNDTIHNISTFVNLEINDTLVHKKNAFLARSRKEIVSLKDLPRKYFPSKIMQGHCLLERTHNFQRSVTTSRILLKANGHQFRCANIVQMFKLSILQKFH